LVQLRGSDGNPANCCHPLQDDVARSEVRTAEWGDPEERCTDVWQLSGFIDEISPDLAEQLDLVAALGLRFVELRSVWDTNLLDLDAAQLARVRSDLRAAGVQVSSIGSPIGKIAITDDNEPHLERMRHALAVAQFFDAPFIRVFSYFIPAGDSPDDHRDEVLSRMRALAAIAEDSGVTLIHENEKEIYGDIPRRCLDIVESVGSPALALTWDNANFVQCGVRPFSAGYSPRPSGPSTQTASTGSCRWSPTWASGTRWAASPVPTTGAGPTPHSSGSLTKRGLHMTEPRDPRCVPNTVRNGGR
jgi:hypothetical protein